MLGRPGLSPVMVGRLGELELLMQRFDALQNSRVPSVVVVTGDAGVGKTRLTQELLRQLPSDVVVLAGTAYEGQHERPYAVVRDAIAREINRWDGLPEDLERFAQPLRQLLGGLLPRVSPGVGDNAAATTEALEDLSGVAVELITFLAQDHRTVIVFEDLHAADAESLDVFERLATQGPPVLLVGTARSEELDRTNEATDMVHRLRRATAIEQVSVAALDPEELRELTETICGSPVSGATTELLYERTRGNPFFLEELVAGARHGGAATAAAPFDAAELAHATMPRSTSEAILRRLERLSPAGHHTMQLVAVLGHEATLTELAAVSGATADGVVESLRELVSMGVLAETHTDVFAFRHALVREAALGDMLTQERRVLHRRVLDALRATGSASPVVLARHAIEAGAGNEAAQLTRRAARFAFDAGAPRTALRLAQDRLRDAPDDAELHQTAARAAARLGELDAAAAHAQAWAAASANARDWVSAVDARCQLAWIEWSAGSANRAWKQVAAAEQAAPHDDDLATAQVLATRAQLHIMGGDADAAVRCADEVLQRRSEHADRQPFRHALVTKAVALVDLIADEEPACMAEPRRLLHVAKQEALAAGDLDTAMRALNNLLQPGIDVVERSQLPGLLAEGQRLADRHGLERFGTKIAALRAHAAVVDGDRFAAEAALGDPRLGRATPMEASFVVALRVHVAVEGGRTDEAAEALSRHYALVQGHTTGEFALFPATAEVELASAVGDAEQAAAALRRATQALPHVASGAAADWWIAGVLALHAGVDAEEVASIAEASAPRPVKRHEGAFRHFRGALEAARGDISAAIDALHAATTSPQAGRPRAIVAAARLQLAELLRGAGEREAARQHAAHAAEDLVRWPGPRRDTVDALRRELGDGPPEPHELLTPREREVVSLLVRGFSNGEIAERLHIARKTAASHVSNILAKTQLQRRGQVASWALRHGLIDPALRSPGGGADHS